MNPTRDALQRVATHVLARARFAAVGRFGLRSTPGGFGTPAFGDGVEVLRVAGTLLVREVGGHASSTPLDGATLTGLAAFAGADLSTTFEAGRDTPPLGEVEEPLTIDEAEATNLADWWHLGWQAIDAAAATADDAMAIQLWPEHFDAGTSVSIGRAEGDRCNLGVSPGDTFSDEPYLYVGPWSDERPGDPAYWNAPFGAVLRRSDVLASNAELNASIAFFCRGLELFRSTRGRPE